MVKRKRLDDGWAIEVIGDPEDRLEQIANVCDEDVRKDIDLVREANTKLRNEVAAYKKKYEASEASFLSEAKRFRELLELTAAGQNAQHEFDSRCIFFLLGCLFGVAVSAIIYIFA